MVYCENDSLLIDPAVRDQVVQQLFAFKEFWGGIHGWLCSIICIFGLLTNILHIIVLTRAIMRTTAVNAILTAVAICDIGTMASYFIYLWHFVLTPMDSCALGFSYGWILFLLGHVFISIDLHNTSLWLAVSMAFVRLVTLQQARLSSPWHRAQRAWKISVAIYMAVLLVCLPNLILHEIIQLNTTSSGNLTACPENQFKEFYTMDVSDTAKAGGCRFFKTNLWVTGIALKVVPCFLLMVLSVSLLMKIREARVKREQLLETRVRPARHTDRTTVMLLAILLIFLITELPQGILAILSAIYTQDVYIYIYAAFGDILDFLSLVNSSANFVLYCLMSSRYRQTFCQVILPASVYRRYYSGPTSTSLAAPGTSTVPKHYFNGCPSRNEGDVVPKSSKSYFPHSPNHSAVTDRLLPATPLVHRRPIVSETETYVECKVDTV